MGWLPQVGLGNSSLVVPPASEVAPGPSLVAVVVDSPGLRITVVSVGSFVVVSDGC